MIFACFISGEKLRFASSYLRVAKNTERILPILRRIYIASLDLPADHLHLDMHRNPRILSRPLW